MTAKPLLILLLLLATRVAWAQLYPKEREQMAADKVRQLLETYSAGLNVIGNPDEDIDERKEYYVDEFKKSFRQPEALVFNDIEPDRRSGTDLPADRYAVNHIIWFPKSGVSNQLNPDQATFSPIQKTAAGNLYINAYVTKSVKGMFMNRIAQSASNRLEFRVGFVDKGNYFTDFRIIGITNLSTPTSATSATIAKNAEQPATTNSDDTKTVNTDAFQQSLASLTRQLVASGLPKSRAIRVEKFTYGTTNLCSQFSKVLNTFLVARLKQMPGLIILSPPAAPPTGNKTLSTDPARVVLTGTFTDKDGQLKLDVAWTDLTTKKTTNLPGLSFPLTDALALNAPLKPENFRQAVAVQQALQTGSITNDFAIDVLTNRGGGRITFTEGDSLKLYVRATKPCYLRFIYHTADGQRVLLDDNFYVDSLNINRYVRIQKYFTVTEPFGAEVLQLNAATKPFPGLGLRRESGYDFITDDINAINQKNRRANAPPDIQRAETRLTITTTRKLK